MAFLSGPSKVLDQQGRPKTRMQAAKDIYMAYLNKEVDWLKLKDKSLRDAAKAEAALEKQRAEQPGSLAPVLAENPLEDLARFFSTEGFLKDEECNNYYNDAVVQGLLHEVMTILGYLNISTPAEELEKAKQNMRACARKSTDASMVIYPVQFQPNNWHLALRPNLRPIDLTMSADVLLADLQTKQEQLHEAETEMSELVLRSVPRAQLQQARDELERGRQKWVDEEAGLIEKYGAGVVTSFKIYLEAQSGGTLAAALALSDGGGTSADKISGALNLGKEVVDAMLGAFKQNTAYFQAADKVARLESAATAAAVGNLETQRARAQARIEQLQSQVEFLKSMLPGVLQRRAQLAPNPDITGADVGDHTKDLANLPTAAPTGDATVAFRGCAVSATDFTTLTGVKDPAKKSEFASWLQTKVTGGLLYDAGRFAGVHLSSEVLGMLQQQKAQTDAAAWATNGQSLKLLNRLLLQATWPCLVDCMARAVPDPDVTSGLLPTPNPDDAEAENLFQEVVITNKEYAQATSDAAGSTSATARTNFGLLFFSAGGQSSSSSAFNSSYASAFSSEWAIGFRVAKVTFDRGGWFNPQFFKLTEHFFRLMDMRAASSVPSPKDALLGVLTQLPPPGQAVASAWENKLREVKGYTYTPPGASVPLYVPYLLPAFPVGMLIVKDVTIKVRVTADTRQSLKTAFEHSSSSGGGFLCFSASSASHTSVSSEATYHGGTSDFYVIRIPGPQVLGWFQEFVSVDNSRVYQPLFDRERKSEAWDILKSYSTPPEPPSGPNPAAGPASAPNA
jgi:hypothetical protein